MSDEDGEKKEEEFQMPTQQWAIVPSLILALKGKHFDRPFLSLSSQTSWTTELRETRAGLATLEMLRTGKVWHRLKEIDEKRNPQCLDQAHKETCVIFFMKIGIKAAGWSFAASRVHYCSVFQSAQGALGKSAGQECVKGHHQIRNPQLRQYYLKGT